MRKFSSYGPINTNQHYYVPRTELIDQTCRQLIGEEVDEGGHYITIWAPRQTGKTWLLQQARQRLDQRGDFEVAILTMQSAKNVETTTDVLEVLITNVRNWFRRDDLPYIRDWKELRTLFTPRYFAKPLILILDEFDALRPEFINAFANEFRSIYLDRNNQVGKPSQEKTYILHGLALIGVRSVLGIENVTGSPFNVQRSVHVPNLTEDEVASMFRWYEEESGQQVEAAVVDRLFYETRGQPGLVSWFGELLTETYNRHESAITEHDFAAVFSAGLNLLPNNNILNIISKANTSPYRETVLKLFNTNEKIPFRYDNRHLNYLYLNGVIEPQPEEDLTYSVRFASPFVQKRLFHYFADELTPSLARLYDPFDDLSDTITETTLSIPHIMHRYEVYLHQHRERLLADVPRRESDNRVMEAIFHFNLYTWLLQFLAGFGGRVVPEFPTGNGKIDLLITYADRLYGVEVKSFLNRKQYQTALEQAARYGQELGQTEIWLVFFVEVISDENREVFEVTYMDRTTGVKVHPVFLATG
ncbi:MAG: AAA-like domain-containing protein [Caldilineaceae bacterium]|nr:AAA-like domain-containing protein [Caldilineaceae bacterium]